jgi:hypothetical protein
MFTSAYFSKVRINDICDEKSCPFAVVCGAEGAVLAFLDEELLEVVRC